MDDRNYRFTSSFVAGLAASGVTHAAVSPGSRNTPMSLTLAGSADITDWPIHDERSAGFFALGIGKATGMPAVVTCTSGTAAAELHPAVVEARYGRVPLVVVTADRPSDLWEAGSPQTVDQRGIFGTAPVWSHDLDVPAPGDASPGLPAALAARLVAEALGQRGPVHLNLRFREPLVPDGPLPDPTGPIPAIDLGTATLESAAVDGLISRLSGKRGVLVAGPPSAPGATAAIARAAGALGFPVIADPQAATETGPATIRSGEALLAAGILDRLTPEVVLRTGPLPVSKPLAVWLAGHPEIEQIHIDEDAWRDPGSSISHAIRADVGRTMEAVADSAPPAAPADWTRAWSEADEMATGALSDAVAAEPFPTEPAVAAAVAASLPEGSLLYAGSSMPIRDVALTLGASGAACRIASNRGANGIDGVISSAMGAAAAHPGPVTALVGDVSALHDLTALATAGRLGLDLTVVVVDNDGGGIFHFLPQADHPDFERHFGTPHGLDLVAAAGALGVAAEEITAESRLREAIASPAAGTSVLVTRTDRSANVGVHRRIASAVAETLG